MNEIDCMCHQNSGLLAQDTIDYVINNVFPDMCIQCRDRIIKKIDIFILVDSSCQSQSSFLSTTKVDAFLTNLCEVTSVHDFKISL